MFYYGVKIDVLNLFIFKFFLYFSGFFFLLLFCFFSFNKFFLFNLVY